jgi:hypothetical protein
MGELITGRYPDEYGLIARSPDGAIPPGTMVRRNPGDPSCPACLSSPDGYCREHPEFSYVPAAETKTKTKTEAGDDG